MRYRKKKVIIILIILFISIGFAYLSTQLSIIGLSSVQGNKWDVHFENVQVNRGSVAAELPVIDTNKTRVYYSCSLRVPGDYYQFTVDAKNDGTIDAMVDSVVKTNLSNNQLKYLDYSVTYVNGTEINNEDIIKAGKKVTYVIRVSYKKDLSASDLPTFESEQLNLSLEINYVQSNKIGQESLIKVINKKGEDFAFGDEVAIGDEHFYIIYANGPNIKLMGKYNLLLGSYSNDNGMNFYELDKNIENYGRQSSLTVDDEYNMNYYGVVNSYDAYEDYFSIGVDYYRDRAIENTIPYYLVQYADYLSSLGLSIESVGIPASYDTDTSGFIDISQTGFWLSDITEEWERSYYDIINQSCSATQANEFTYHGLRPVIYIEEYFFNSNVE